MLKLIAHTELFFPVLLVGLMLVVELGFRVRRASDHTDPERQQFVESARDGLGVLLGFLRVGLIGQSQARIWRAASRATFGSSGAIEFVGCS